MDIIERIKQIEYFLGGSACNWLAWQLPSIAGILLADVMPTHWGLGFAGVLASVPPMVGQCLIAANTMFGNHVSMPYFALPSTFSGRSMRGTRFPMTRNFAGSVNRRSAGTDIDAAAAASDA